MESSDTESEDGCVTEGSSFDSSEETTVKVQSEPPQFVQKLIMFAAGLKFLLSAIMNTAGKVVVTLLLGLAGMSWLGTHQLVVLIFWLVVMCCYVCRYHSALPHVWSVFWGVSRAGVVVDIQPLHQHAAFQFSVCDDGYLQCRTSACSVSVSVANVAAACTTRRHLCQV